MNRLKLMIPPMPWHRVRRRQADGDRVVLLHGLWRSLYAMESLAVSLHEQGFETLNIPYASFRKTLPEIVEDVARELRADSSRKTHFVTHSMGGIVIRELAARHPDLVTGKVVMLAPPNQGSEIIDWLEDFPIARWSLGPGGLSLSTQKVRSATPLLPDDIDLTVIMGNRANLPFFKPLLSGESDGIVTTEGGKLPTMARFELIDGDHTFIMGEEAAYRLILQTLQS